VPSGSAMLFTGLASARLIFLLIWLLTIGSVVANAFELPMPWRLGRLERPVMYGAFFLGGGAFWILAFTSSSVLELALLILSVAAVPCAGLLIGRTLRQRQSPGQSPPEATPTTAGKQRARSPSEPPKAA
jgi:hypothetical protein